MPRLQPSADFKPWTSNLILAGYGVLTLGLAYHFLLKRGHEYEFMGALAVAGGFTVYQWKQYVRRSYGKRIESKAVAALSKAIARIEDSSVAAGVLLSGGGDADAVLVLRGVRFNIEIKAIESPGKVTAKHAAQAMKAGAELFSIPVIWLPCDQVAQAREKKGVRVFSGDAQSLVKYLGKLK